ncbi:uncharacterized protein LOC109821010 [Asparagus officinalis]|uniref:uncharacterized protein LOC109821010 n=1 Tax=Asparagus officinalis TaxID=4686 RepID=UPI00098DFD49|nr:uncharacterized protein LOC109821010 [Asparagus officinalis]
MNAMIGKLFHGGLSLRQFKPFLDSKVNLIREAGHPDLAQAIVDDLDCLEHELQMFRELRDAGASSFIAAELDTRLQSSRETRIFAELEIQMQRGRVDRVKTSLATRLSSLADLDLSITSCATEIDQLRRTLREKEENLDILQMTKAQDQQTHTALSDELRSLEQKLAETEEIAARTSAATEEPSLDEDDTHLVTLTDLEEERTAFVADQEANPRLGTRSGKTYLKKYDQTAQEA